MTHTPALPPPHPRHRRGWLVDPVRAELETAAPVRRVRHQVRDGAAVIAFSAAASTGLALALLVLVQLAGPSS